jgi:hypothetical protein
VHLVSFPCLCSRSYLQQPSTKFFDRAPTPVPLDLAGAKALAVAGGSEPGKVGGKQGDALPKLQALNEAGQEYAAMPALVEAVKTTPEEEAILE